MISIFIVLIWCLGPLARSKGRSEWLKKYQLLNLMYWGKRPQGGNGKKDKARRAWIVAMVTRSCGDVSRGFPAWSDPPLEEPALHRALGITGRLLPDSIDICFSLWVTLPFLFPFCLLKTTCLKSLKPHLVVAIPTTLCSSTSPD